MDLDRQETSMDDVVLTPIYATPIGCLPKPTSRSRKPIKSAPEKWLAEEVLAKLEHVFPKSSGNLILPSVRDGLSDLKSARVADAIVISTWPSRGLFIAGIEIKVTKTDWRAELRNAAKAEAFAKYCQFWYMAFPTTVVPLGEIPPRWGAISVRRDGATIVKQAILNEDAIVPEPFFISLIKAAAKKEDLENESTEEEGVVAS